MSCAIPVPRILSLAVSAIALDPGQIIDLRPKAKTARGVVLEGFEQDDDDDELDGMGDTKRPDTKSGIVVAVGDYRGVSFARANAPKDWADLKPSLPLPSGFFRVRREASSGGSIDFYHYELEEGEDPNEFAAGIATRTAGGMSKSDGLIRQVARGLITPAAIGTQVTPTSSSVRTVRITADQANANPIVVAETQAKAALLLAAGGGTPIYPTGIYTFNVKSGQLWLASSTGAELCYPMEDVEG